MRACERIMFEAIAMWRLSSWSTSCNFSFFSLSFHQFCYATRTHMHWTFCRATAFTFYRNIHICFFFFPLSALYEPDQPMYFIVQLYYAYMVSQSLSLYVMSFSRNGRCVCAQWHIWISLSGLLRRNHIYIQVSKSIIDLRYQTLILAQNGISK